MGLKDKSLVKQEELSAQDREFLRAKITELFILKPEAFKGTPDKTNMEGPVLDFFVREMLEAVRKVVSPMDGKKVVPKDLAKVLGEMISITIEQDIKAQDFINVLRDGDEVIKKYGSQSEVEKVSK